MEERIMSDFPVDDLSVWETNAAFWDTCMGDDSNSFHREVVRPGVTELLSPQAGDVILDIACGNGNYSAFMAKRGAKVLAFDQSPAMIALARKRQRPFQERIEFCVADAAKLESLLPLRRTPPFSKAVSCMAIMDISDVRPLFEALQTLLADKGIFVFATQHPCFVTLTKQYRTEHAYLGEAIAGQPCKQRYYHRSMQEIFRCCFDAGFVIDGFLEAYYRNPEIPEVIIVRARKN